MAQTLIVSFDEAGPPAAVAVPCPARGFASRYVVRCCKGCPHFQGFLRVQAEAPWPRGYRVLCAHPIARSMTIVEDD